MVTPVQVHTTLLVATVNPFAVIVWVEFRLSASPCRHALVHITHCEFVIGDSLIMMGQAPFIWPSAR